MGRERGGRATRFARRGTHATGSGGSPASWDSTTSPETRLRPRRPAPGALVPHEHRCKDRGAIRRSRVAEKTDLVTPLTPWVASFSIGPVPTRRKTP